jgi:hypothetical protein
MAGPFLRTHLWPRTFIIGVPRRLDGVLRILRRALGDDGEGFIRGRVEDFASAALRSLHPFTANEDWECFHGHRVVSTGRLRKRC